MTARRRHLPLRSIKGIPLICQRMLDPQGEWCLRLRRAYSGVGERSPCCWWEQIMSQQKLPCIPHSHRRGQWGHTHTHGGYQVQIFPQKHTLPTPQPSCFTSSSCVGWSPSLRSRYMNPFLLTSCPGFPQLGFPFHLPCGRPLSDSGRRPSRFLLATGAELQLVKNNYCEL